MSDYTPDFFAKTNKPLKSFFLYENRRWYKEKTTEIFSLSNNNYIDLWYDVPYYGKVDRRGFLVVPKKTKIDFAAGQSIASFSFVLQALDEMKYFLQRKKVHGRSKLANLFKNFDIKTSFYDSSTAYISYSRAGILSYNAFLVKMKKMVLDYDTYVCEFIKYLDFIKRPYFSYYSFFASNLTPVAASGLAVSFFKKDNDDDTHKNEFFQNEAFGIYAKVVANFGFRINKNAPWMLIADLESKPMQRPGKIDPITKETLEVTGFMKQHFIRDTNDFFDKYYDKVMTSSFFYLQGMMVEGYREFRQRMKYLVSSDFDITSDFITNTISNINIERHASVIHKITPDTFSPIESTFQANDPILVLLEKILYREFSTTYDREYKAFKAKFDQLSSQGGNIYKILYLLESFYSATKIFDPRTAKPMWRTPKNNLTPKNENVMIPNDKQKPSTSKIVTEFYTGH
jgi:hypothetical protein